MDVRPFDDAALFGREAAAYLAADPFSSSVIAVRVDGVLRGIRDPRPQDRYWTVVEAQERGTRDGGDRNAYAAPQCVLGQDARRRGRGLGPVTG